MANWRANSTFLVQAVQKFPVEIPFARGEPCQFAHFSKSQHQEEEQTGEQNGSNSTFLVQAVQQFPVEIPFARGEPCQFAQF